MQTEGWVGGCADGEGGRQVRMEGEGERFLVHQKTQKKTCAKHSFRVKNRRKSLCMYVSVCACVCTCMCESVCRGRRDRISEEIPLRAVWDNDSRLTRGVLFCMFGIQASIFICICMFEYNHLIEELILSLCRHFLHQAEGGSLKRCIICEFGGGSGATPSLLHLGSSSYPHSPWPFGDPTDAVPSAHEEAGCQRGALPVAPKRAGVPSGARSWFSEGSLHLPDCPHSPCREGLCHVLKTP